jgi:hypothetical protein
MKVKTRRLSLAILSLATVSALGTGNASAAGLLFEPLRVINPFPYHFTGLTVGTSTFETDSGKTFETTAIHVLALVLNKTLFDFHVLLLGLHAEGTTLAPCGDTASTTASEHVLIELLGHFGLAHPGNRHAVLLELHENFAFFCHNPINGLNEEVKLKGALIGTITKPKAGVEASELGLVFKQTPKGKQEFTEFLLTGVSTPMTNQFLLMSRGGGAFLQVGEATPEVVLKPLLNEGNFRLVLD